MTRFLRRRAMLVGASALALVAAGIAVAGPAPSSMSLVSATFSTGAPTNSHSHTCIGANNAQITVTDATYTGTASSADSRLNGAITIHVHSVYDGNQGTLSGDVRIDSSATPVNHFHASLNAVDVTNNVQGWITGHAGPGAQIAGAFLAPFTATGGFGSGTIGATTGVATDPALVTSGNCNKPPSPAPNPPKNGNGPKSAEVNGPAHNGPGHNGPGHGKHHHGH
jgi:hypothetical protein